MNRHLASFYDGDATLTAMNAGALKNNTARLGPVCEYTFAAYNSHRAANKVR